MSRIKRITVTDYANSPNPGHLAIFAGLILAGFLFLPGGCSTVEGMGKDIQASSRIVREWWNRDKDKPAAFYMDASIDTEEKP